MVLYNSDPDQVREAIRSCTAGTIKADLTVVDNSPHQELKALVEEFGASYLPTPNNLGFGAGHNLALRESLEESTYHLVVNPDVHFGPEVLPTLYAVMQANPEIGLVMPKVLYPDNQEQHLCKRLPGPLDLMVRRFGGSWAQRLFEKRSRRYMLGDLDLSVPRVVPSLSGCFMFLRTAVLRRVGLFDERFFMYMEDVDLCRRVGSVAQTVFFPEVSIHHGYQKGSYRDPHLLAHHSTSAFRYFQKWGWFADEERERRNRAAYSNESILDVSGVTIRKA